MSGDSDKIGVCADGTLCGLCQRREGFCQHHDGDPSTSAGRPEYEPTDQDRRTVKALASAGWTKTRIAEVIGIDPATLTKHMGKLLERSEDQAIAAVASTFFELAVSGQHPRQTLQWLERRDPEHWQPPKERKDLTSDGDKIRLESGNQLAELLGLDVEQMDTADNE